MTRVPGGFAAALPGTVIATHVLGDFGQTIEQIFGQWSFLTCVMSASASCWLRHRTAICGFRRHYGRSEISKFAARNRSAADDSGGPRARRPGFGSSTSL